MCFIKVYISPLPSHLILAKVVHRGEIFIVTNLLQHCSLVYEFSGIGGLMTVLSVMKRTVLILFIGLNYGKYHTCQFLHIRLKLLVLFPDPPLLCT